MIVFLPKKVDYKNQVRSSDLTETNIEDGNVQRIDYLDENGKLTFASDKHYATIIKTSADNTLLEKYYDENGRLSQQPSYCYAILREYDENGRNNKLTYLGIDDKPIMISSGYSIIKRSFNQDNRIEWEMYFDTTGNPVNSVYSGYGCHKEYDENGRNTKITYVDEERNPTITKLGYAVRQNTFYDDGVWLGKVENEFYYDESEKPIALSNGEFGLHREYDDLGRSTVLTYLDINGKPMLTNKGYTTIKGLFIQMILCELRCIMICMGSR